MATIELTKDTFAETVNSNEVVLIDFWATWCGPCRTFAPIFETVSEQFPNAVFGKVDTEDQPELAGAFNVMSIPTLMVFRDNVLLYAQPGALPEAALTDLVNQALALDMDAVRAEIAGEQDQATGSAAS